MSPRNENNNHTMMRPKTNDGSTYIRIKAENGARTSKHLSPRNDTRATQLAFTNVAK